MALFSDSTFTKSGQVPNDLVCRWGAVTAARSQHRIHLHHSMFLFFILLRTPTSGSLTHYHYFCRWHFPSQQLTCGRTEFCSDLYFYLNGLQHTHQHAYTQQHTQNTPTTRAHIHTYTSHIPTTHTTTKCTTTTTNTLLFIHSLLIYTHINSNILRFPLDKHSLV